MDRSAGQRAPADTRETKWTEDRANALLAARLEGVQRLPAIDAARASSVHKHDYVGTYVNDLERVIDFESIRGANLKLGIDPLGGASVAYWTPIAERYRMNLVIFIHVVG